MTVGASGGSDFDVVFVESDFVSQMGKAGILEPLNDYEANSETLHFSDFVDSTIERNTLNGTVYAIPQVADVQTTLYNKDILENLVFQIRLLQLMNLLIIVKKQAVKVIYQWR